MVTFQKEFERGKMYLTVTQMCSAAGHYGIFLKKDAKSKLDDSIFWGYGH